VSSLHLRPSPQGLPLRQELTTRVMDRNASAANYHLVMIALLPIGIVDSFVSSYILLKYR
jgi:hypothetical protein